MRKEIQCVEWFVSEIIIQFFIETHRIVPKTHFLLCSARLCNLLAPGTWYVGDVEWPWVSIDVRVIFTCSVSPSETWKPPRLWFAMQLWEPYVFRVVLFAVGNLLSTAEEADKPALQGVLLLTPQCSCHDLLKLNRIVTRCSESVAEFIGKAIFSYFHQLFMIFPLHLKCLRDIGRKRLRKFVVCPNRTKNGNESQKFLDSARTAQTKPFLVTDRSVDVTEVGKDSENKSWRLEAETEIDGV